MIEAIDAPAAAGTAADGCPLCGQPNQCAMELERTTGLKQGPCWCTQVDFTHELLARVPEGAIDRACICARCAASATPAGPAACARPA